MLAAAGCSAPTGQVTGKITLKKKPVPHADLRFEPAGGDVFYRGLSDDDGTYYVDYKNRGGLPAGAYKVVVTYHTYRNKLLPPGEKGDSLKNEEETIAQEIIFEKTVAAGANEFHFELTEGQKGKTSGGIQPDE
jgi:hypothetical protein